MMHTLTDQTFEQPLPAAAAPVRLAGRMGPNGYEAENREWLPFLTRPDRRLGTRGDGRPRRAGLDPMELPLSVLIASGHPPRRTSALVSALGNPNNQHAGNEEGDPMGALGEIRSCRDIPAYCDECAGSAHLRRRCAATDAATASRLSCCPEGELSGNRRRGEFQT